MSDEGDTQENARADFKALLKRLRTERQEQVSAAKERNKRLALLRRTIKKALATGPMTVPALAAAADAPTEEVLWHVMAMRAYGQVAEGDQDGSYFQYRLVDTGRKGR